MAKGILNETISPRTLGVARILVFGLWLLNVHTIYIEDLGFLPNEVIDQHGLLRLLPRAFFELLVYEPVAIGLRGLLTVLLAWLILGLPGYAVVAIVTAVLLTLFDGLGKSLGHINHAKFAMLYAAWIMAAFPAAADALSLSRRRAPERSPIAYAAPMVAVALVICTAYMFVGAYRLHAEGTEIFFSDTLRFWFVRRSMEHNPTGYTLGIWVASQPILMSMAQIGFAVGTLMELMAPICLFNRTYRLLWVAGITVFHVANLATMNINFWQNAVLVLFFVSDIDKVLAPGALRARLAGWSRPPPAEAPG